MSRKRYLATIALVGGVSIVLGMLLASGPLRRANAPQPAVWSPAEAATTALSAGPAVASFADVAENANPAVVSVANVEFKKVDRDPHHEFDFPFEDPFKFFFGPRERSPQKRGQGQGQGDEQGEDDSEEQRFESGGSGFIISDDGYIMTNNHVIEGASKLEVGLENGEKYPAKLIGKDEMLDLALIKIEAPHKLQTLPLGDSDALRVGEWVIAIGNPLNYEHTVTVGVVSGKGRQLQDPTDPKGSLANFIQTDAAINFGNSGGPLLNSRGQVIGINTAITRNYGPYSGLIEGIGFALPINQAHAVLDRLKENGKVSHGYLGVQISQVGEKEKSAWNLPSRSGAFVQSVTKGQPGAEAGLQPGDVIVAIDGSAVKDTAELIQVISSKQPGESVALGVIREGKEISLKVKLADRAKGMIADRGGEEKEEGDEAEENDSSAATTEARLGVTVAEITKDVERRVELPPNHPKGVLVESVRPSSNAYEENLRRGMIITKVNNTPVAGLSEFRAAVSKIKSGDWVKLYTTYYTQEGEGSRFVVFQAQK